MQRDVGLKRSQRTRDDQQVSSTEKGQVKDIHFVNSNFVWWVDIHTPLLCSYLGQDFVVAGCTQLANATFEGDDDISLRRIAAVVSIRLWPDGAGLTRFTLERAAEVVAMGKGER